MPTKSFILAAFLAVSHTFNLFAQLENTKWYFGVNNGINFTPNGATFTIGTNSHATLTGTEGRAIATNPITGNVMFYSDGITLYDATNAPMDGHPIGGLGGCNSAAMVIAFCKVPTKCNQYYVFTNRTGDVANCGTPQINVYIVDMTGNSGLGHILALGEWDVVPSDNILTTNASETMMTIPGSNPDEYWLVGRRPNGNMFSYKIDALFQSNFLAGSTANLVTSTIGLPGSTSYNMEYSGNASVSNNIAMIFSSFNNTLYTMKFDNSSGSFSESTLRASNLGGTGYDVEFSQDASKL